MGNAAPDAEVPRRSRRSPTVIVGLALALLVALAGAIWWVVASDDDGERGGAATPSSDEAPRPILRRSDPSGSGCSPGTEALPDGWWFGWIESGIATGPPYEFDLACYFHERHPDDGDAIQNDSTRLRTVPAVTEVEVVCIDVEAPTGASEAPCPPLHPDGTLPVWILIEDGIATKVVEQFIP